MGLFSGPGVSPSLKGLPTNILELNSGSCFLLSPAGWYSTKPGKYTSLQQYDPITTTWQNIGAGSVAAPKEYFYSDGVNYRLANQTGCPVGAIVTTAGSGYTSPPAVTSPNGAVWRAIVGGAVATTVTVSNGGTNYTYPPIVLLSAPPSPGVQATAYCTLSGSAVSTVTIVDQGAGYASPPIVTFVNDPREGQNNVTQGSGAAAVATLTGSGTVTAILCLDHGTGGQTSVPALTISGGGGSSAAATAVMCWSVTAYVVSATTTGSGYSNPVLLSGYVTSVAASAILNPTIGANLVKGRSALIVGSAAAGVLTATGQTVLDGGIYPAAPTMFSYPGPAGTAGTFATLLAPTMGGQTDISELTPV